MVPEFESAFAARLIDRQLREQIENIQITGQGFCAKDTNHHSVKLSIHFEC
jgi:hypothetical protein